MVIENVNKQDRFRVAVLYSGKMRTGAFCNRSFAEHVIAANPSVHFDIYAYITVDNSDSALAAQMQTFPLPISDSALAAQRLARETFAFERADLVSVVVEQENSRTRALRIEMPGIYEAEVGSSRWTTNALNVARMFHGISAAENIRVVVETEQKRPVPALVMRIRPDLCLCGDLPLESALLEGSVFVPWSSNTLAFDQIAVGPPHLMARYASVFNTTLREALDSDTKHALHPEMLLRQHLSSRNIPFTSALKKTHLRAALARGSQSVAGMGMTFDDPFAKLKFDFPEQAHSMPPYSCAAYFDGGKPSSFPAAKAMPHHFSLAVHLVWCVFLVLCAVLCVSRRKTGIIILKYVGLGKRGDE